ncbi:energy-coupling factor transporter ATPase [Serpentinicella sp. ANB-PHB4]|uniref:energy-coupling factor transporter ATPase n=1 Tax=Serpentinicella sp. ANB-PHB4 TaxID=3074076 RepID=UPI002861A04A|nr:energy-coupling factor transporter ATPase [Serpentinicella sp. ANB-PHB4]MDR5659521.1 energy-coupling factor transporter ATPase [Serpentinicella sp. ANB-PHB4]
MNKIIKFKDLTYKYTDNDESSTALNSISKEINQGEFVVIIGHNGSGKSTLAKLLNALLLPTSGDVYIMGNNTKNSQLLWEIRETAGMVFQNPDNQIVATVVEEDVAFGPENLGIESNEIKIRVEEALNTVGMLEFRNKAPHMLSGGQKQRVAIAGVIAMRPSCIIFDEPTAMLDPAGRKEVMDTIRKLNKDENITIIHITHFMEEAVDADRIIVMEEGQVILEGLPREVFSKVKALKSIGLDVPQVTELAHELIEAGVNLPEDILTVDEMVMHLCQLN